MARKSVSESPDRRELTKRILAVVAEHGPLSHAKIAEKLGIASDMAFTVVQQLSKSGRVKWDRVAGGFLIACTHCKGTGAEPSVAAVAERKKPDNT